MIAIGIVLGQRANVLDRGTSARNLIQNGKNSAKIQLCLSNDSHHYKFDFFKSSIIIERLLKRDGTCTLRIKNEMGKIYSTKKDLDFLLEQFQLHFGNPLNFLTQENSKKFLRITNAQNLYSLFM